MLLALFSIAFGLRILYAAVIGTNPGVNPSPGTYDYYLARSMHDNTAWVTEPFTPNAPGYPVLLAAAFRVLGVRQWVVILMQAFLGAVTALFLYRIGERTLGRGVGLLSALWLALSVHQMHFASVFVRDTAVTFALVWFVHTAVRRFVKMRQAVWTGMVYTLLIHFDAQFLLLLPAVLLYFVFFATQHRILNVQYVFLFLATVMVVSLPWTIRNTLVYGEIIPIGLEAQRYTEPLTGWISPSPGSIEGDERVTRAHADGLLANTVEFWRVMRFGADEGSGDGRTEPPWSLRHNLASILSFGLLLPFALAGLVVAWRRRTHTVLFLLLIILTDWLVHAVIGATDRDRLVIEPLVILIAMYGLVEVVRAARHGAESDEAAPDSTAVGA
jgi:4-amino-4-deoxy-L-arabinose transferase-like glycosyltransferase